VFTSLRTSADHAIIVIVFMPQLFVLFLDLVNMSLEQHLLSMMGKALNFLRFSVRDLIIPDDRNR